MRQHDEKAEPLGLVWINCPDPIVALGLRQALQTTARVYVEGEAPKGAPFAVVYCADSVEDVSNGIGRIRELHPDASVLVFSVHVNLPLAHAAIQLGARGFVHAGMSPTQIARVVKVASQGEMVAPRQLLEYLLAQEDSVDPNVLTPRQQEILELVVDGLSNAEIVNRLYLSESTVKQHLRAAYKLLGVNNRTEAAKRIRGSSQPGPNQVTPHAQSFRELRRRSRLGPRVEVHPEAGPEEIEEDA
jgi:DNA-binding NarL/FixJ family response regulator